MKSGRAAAIAAFLYLSGAPLRAQDPAASGSIRGVVKDRDFDAPLPLADVSVLETGQKAVTGDQGNYLVGPLKPGRYTVTLFKEGYVRQNRTVQVNAGALADADASLEGDFVDLEEFVVKDALDLGTGTEASLLELRFESPALMDSVSSDLISKAGASDAAAALRLVSGASVADGKSAVVRGLPDRYVSNQLNGVRLPTADETKRSVDLDLFPASILESIQVSKTFTPDQQGDASGGAVNVVLRGIPDEPWFLNIKSQASVNTQASGSDFLTYRGGGLTFFGRDDGGRDRQLDALGMDWEGAVGVTRGSAPFDHKWSMSFGGTEDLGDGMRLGGLGSLFYERDSSFVGDGVDNSLWVVTPGAGLTPETGQGDPQQGQFNTALFDITQGKQSVQWGGMGAVGFEMENHSFALAYLHSRTAEDVATLAEDVRGKEHFFPGHDPLDPNTPGHLESDAAPYLRMETLEYTERTLSSVQLKGRHTLPMDDFALGEAFTFKAPEIDWIAAYSSAALDQPDKRQFGSAWYPARDLGFIVIPAHFRGLKPAANINFGNLQRIWKEIEEESKQFQLNVKLPFEQWSGDEGFLKAGLFVDRTDRSFDQDSFGNFNDNSTYDAPTFSEFWSAAFPAQIGQHAITESTYDVDYEAAQKIDALYLMADVPLASRVRAIGGFRIEGTSLRIVNDPEADATWFPPGSAAPTQLNPGDADVNFEQTDFLPSFGLEYKPVDEVTLRGAFNRTVARQTFRELTPIIQQEYLGGPIFVGNPFLKMSAVENWDLRADYVPYPGALVSASWFRKNVEDPIEYVQRVEGFNHTTAVNYPRGRLTGFEFEVRQHLGELWDPLAGLQVGANATFISSEVFLPEDEIAAFNLPNIAAPTTSRDMTNAPERLFNVYLTYDLEATRTQFAVFYTVQGDTLVAGAGSFDGHYVPDVYALEYGTLNFSVTQKLGEHFALQFQAKNLLNPDIETVYRSVYTGPDALKTSTSAGAEFSLTLSAEFTF